jgi:hypothetical protein
MDGSPLNSQDEVTIVMDSAFAAFSVIKADEWLPNLSVWQGNDSFHLICVCKLWYWTLCHIIPGPGCH